MKAQPIPSREEEPARPATQRRGIALPFLERPAFGHDLLVMNHHAEWTDDTIDRSALTIFNLDRP